MKRCIAHKSKIHMHNIMNKCVAHSYYDKVCVAKEGFKVGSQNTDHTHSW